MLLVLAAVVVWVYHGTLSAARLASELNPHRVRVYLFGIVAQWLMFALVLVGVIRAGTPVGSVIGERWRSPRDLLRDIGIAAAFWIIALLGLYRLEWLVGAKRLEPGVLALMPRSRFEMTLWLVVSATAGICEEAIFRGYLQRQFIVLTRSRPTGILLAAAPFGLGHLYQGWRMAIVMGLYGVMFGALAYWRRSLRPGMIAHTWHDAFSGIVFAILLRR